VLIDTKVCWWMNDRLPPKGMYSGSCDIFNFWKINADISETVQDRDIIAMKFNKKSYEAYI